MNSVVIELDGIARTKERPRVVSLGDRKIAYTPKATRAYETALGWAARREMGARPLLTGPLTMSIVVSMPIPDSWTKQKRRAAEIGDIVPVTKPDVDNFAKLVCDSLNCVVYPDDKQVAFLTVSKVYSAKPGLRVEVATMKGGQSETA